MSSSAEFLPSRSGAQVAAGEIQRSLHVATMGDGKSPPPDGDVVARSLLSGVLQQLPVGVIVAAAPSGRLIAGNEHVARIFRRPFIPSASIADYGEWQGYHRDGTPYRPEEWPMARAILRGETVQGEELTIRRGDGTTGVIRVEAAPVHGSDGQVVAGVITFTDMTEQRQTADRMTRLHFVTASLSEVLTPDEVASVVVGVGRAALKASGGYIALLDSETQYLNVLGGDGSADDGERHRHRLPLHASLPIAEAVRTRAPIWLETKAQIVQRFGNVARLQGGADSHALAAVPLTVEGRTLGALRFSFAQPRQFTDEDREFILALALQCAQALERARLYEAEQRARQRAEQALEARNEFLSAAAHELKTPLTSLIGMAQLEQVRLAKGLADKEHVHDVLDKIVHQGRRLSRLVEQLLDISRLERGILPLRRERVNVADVVRAVVAVVDSPAVEHLVIVRSEVEAVAYVDPLRLEQVVTSLLDNAFKYTPQGTTVEVEVTMPSLDRVQITVRDDGPGIASEHRERVFERFYRGNPNTSLSGLGLGLYLSRAIAEAHGGRLDAQFPDGGGTVMTVTLPVSPIAKENA